MTRNRAPDSGPYWRGPKLLGCILGGVCVVGFCLATRYYQGTTPAHAYPSQQPAAAESGTAGLSAGASTLPQDDNARPAASSPRFGPQAAYAQAPAYPQTQGPAYPQTQGYAPAGYQQPVRPAVVPGGKVVVAPAQAASPVDGLKVVATVNGEDIGREELARDCLQHFGKDVLERLVNKYLVMQACQRQGLVVSVDEVNAEVERMASKFKLPVHEWLKLLKQERGVTAEQYASDIIWPTLALRKLAGTELEVTDEEIKRAYDSQYGEAVKARMIVCNDARSAEQVRAAAVAAPDSFGALAKKYSKDVSSAASMGVIPPIHRFQGQEEIELVAFTLGYGEISKPIKVGDQYVILKCEGHLQATASVPLEKVKMGLNEMIRENKMRRLASEIFRRLRSQAQVVNVMNDPLQSRAHPGVAALINGVPINVSELARVCIDRRGQEALEGTINRRLLEQACKRQRVAVTAADMDQEIARAAAAMLPLKPDGQPDTAKLIEKITKEQGITVDVYRADSVWPSVALKKLVGDKVEVTQEDLQKGFEANYGPRMRVRAIVFNNQRKAQQVWELARKDPSEETFAELAEKYSIEAASRALRGEVPPIQKWSGQPAIEKAAFALKQGDLSPILDMGHGQYVVLFGLGLTKPTPVTFDEVKQQIYDDVHEKKQRLKMADYFQKLQDEATVDNYLAGTSHAPKRSDAMRAEAASYQRPVR
jgi:parvulin-like peptidyl-prolyl isomerase